MKATVEHADNAEAWIRRFEEMASRASLLSQKMLAGFEKQPFSTSNLVDALRILRVRIESDIEVEELALTQWEGASALLQRWILKEKAFAARIENDIAEIGAMTNEGEEWKHA